MEAPTRTPDGIRTLTALRALLQQAEQQTDDPDSRIAADLFRETIRRREWELAGMVASPRPEKALPDRSHVGMDVPTRTPQEIQTELVELRALLQQAERPRGDPDARIAAELFREIIRRREWELAGIRSTPKPEKA
jgi:hypothetical protein